MIKKYKIFLILLFITFTGCLSLTKNAFLSTFVGKDIFVTMAVSTYHSEQGKWPTNFDEVANLSDQKDDATDMLTGVSILSSDQSGCIVLIHSSEASKDKESKFPNPRKIKISLVDKNNERYKGQYLADASSGAQLEGDIDIDLKKNKLNKS